MEPPIIDLSDKVYNITHRAIRFGLTMMVWSGMILFFADQFATKPVMAHHSHEMIKQ